MGINRIRMKESVVIEMLSERSFKTKLTLVLGSTYGLSLVNAVYPMIRFADRRYNLYFMMAIMCIPFFLFAIGVNYEHWYSKIAAFMTYSLVSLFSGIVIIFLLYSMSHMPTDQYDPSFSIVKSYSYHDNQVKIYRIKGGALTTFGTQVRQEKRIFGGVLIVHQLFYTNNSDDVLVEFERDHLVIEGQAYPIKENVYF